MAVTYRPPRHSELAECAMIWYSAVDGYMSWLNRPMPPPYLDPLLSLLEHLLRTDPERFLVAVSQPGIRSRHSREQVVGFGVAVQREHVWYLSQLYVLPAEQGHGIGHALLRQILPSVSPERADEAAAPPSGHAPSSRAPSGRRPKGQAQAAAAPDARPGVLAMCTDSAQPVSNALYARYGIVPRVPVFNLVGTPRPALLEPLPASIQAVPFGRKDPTAAMEAIDREVLGYAHRVDHAHLQATGRTGFVYRTKEGEPVGYGYSSETGRFGPVALLDETLTAPVLGHLMTLIKPRGATSVWVPGANDRAMVAFLRTGLRIEGFPALLCWSRPFAQFDRYVPASLALL